MELFCLHFFIIFFNLILSVNIFLAEILLLPFLLSFPNSFSSVFFIWSRSDSVWLHHLTALTIANTIDLYKSQGQHSIIYTCAVCASLHSSVHYDSESVLSPSNMLELCSFFLGQVLSSLSFFPVSPA